jgi:HEAT repeat protein
MNLRTPCAFLAVILAGVGMAGCSRADSSSDGADGRLRSLQRMAERGGEEAVRQLAEACHDNDVTLAAEAVSLLGRVAGASADAALAEVAASEPRAELRQMAVRALGERRAADSASILKRAVRSDSSPDVRGEAAAGLARLGIRAEAPGLIEAAVDETDTAVIAREMAAAEQLVGVHFPYDTRAPEAARREALRQAATLSASLVRTDRKVGSCAHEETPP